MLDASTNHTFTDLSPLRTGDGIAVRTAADVRRQLEQRRGCDPLFAEIAVDRGNRLLLGVGALQCCAQFSRDDGAAPYLLAYDEQSADPGQLMTFIINGTRTEIPGAFRITFETALAIAETFVERGELDGRMAWKELGAVEL